MQTSRALRCASVLVTALLGAGCPETPPGADGGTDAEPPTSSKDAGGAPIDERCPEAITGSRFGVCRFSVEVETGALSGARFGTEGTVGPAAAGVSAGTRFGVQAESVGGR